MTQARADFRFSLETHQQRGPLRTHQQFGAQGFDSDRGTVAGIGALVDHTHGTPSKHRFEVIAADDLTRSRHHATPRRGGNVIQD